MTAKYKREAEYALGRQITEARAAETERQRIAYERGRQE